jgi:putative phage-type endonuclease
MRGIDGLFRVGLQAVEDTPAQRQAPTGKYFATTTEGSVIDHKTRRFTLGSSEVACLMTGDAPKILQLYKEKIGEAEPENLDNVWAVQLGKATEGLNLDWYEKKVGYLLQRGLYVKHKEHPWAAATLDGYDQELHCPVECKHCGGYELFEELIDRYQPQMQWQMFICDVQQCAFSVIQGAKEPVIEYVKRDDDYIAIMLERAMNFMECVMLREPPVELQEAPKVTPPVGELKDYDMEGDNEWAEHAGKFVETYEAAGINEDAKKALKKMFPEDAKNAHGHGVNVMRYRANRVHVRVIA